MKKHMRLGATMGLVLTCACGDPAVSDGPWIAETTHLSDTVVVQTLSGSAWGRPAGLAEELRLGSIEGGDVTAFGDVSHVALARDGSIFLFDAQVPQLYRFDTDGTLLGRVGREGRGPGEYTGDVTGLVVLGDRVILADASNARLSAFASDGTFEGSIGQVSGLRSLFSPALAPGPDGGMALSVLMVRPEPGVPIPDPWPIGLEYLYTPRGRIWARRPTTDPEREASWRAPRYQPSVMDVFEPDGTYLGVVPMPANSRPVAVTDTHVYVIELGSLDEQYLVRYRVVVPG